jgi:hypothetical protein
LSIHLFADFDHWIFAEEHLVGQDLSDSHQKEVLSLDCWRLLKPGGPLVLLLQSLLPKLADVEPNVAGAGLGRLVMDLN